VTPRNVSIRKIRITRPIFLNGEHADEGSVHDVEQGLAEDLVRQGSAVELNVFSRFFAWMRSFVPGAFNSRRQ
jgi:hypothetical protein